MIFTNFISSPPTPEETQVNGANSLTFLESATSKLRRLIQVSAPVKLKEEEPPEFGPGKGRQQQQQRENYSSVAQAIQLNPASEKQEGAAKETASSPSGDRGRQSKHKQLDWQLKRKYTLSEVQQHSSLDDCWMVIFDKVYDITQFVDEHPGGDFILLEYAGRDATHPFLSSRHGSSAYKMLDKYWIGILVDEELYYSNNSSYCSVYSNLSWRSSPTLEELTPTSQQVQPDHNTPDQQQIELSSSSSTSSDYSSESSNLEESSPLSAHNPSSTSTSPAATCLQFSETTLENELRLDSSAAATDDELEVEEVEEEEEEESTCRTCTLTCIRTAQSVNFAKQH